MNYFSEENGSLIFRENGETVMVTPWGTNSLRVRSVILGEIRETEAALLPKEEISGGVIHLEEDGMSAVITNGAIAAKLIVQPWGRALQITFTDADGKVLLQEIENGGALQLKARQFKTLPGGSFRLKASFLSDPKEKIYGMGQYQQERMNLKGCSLELAHRNSQASIPFYVSSLGYGFLWNNPPSARCISG